jgi:hypothetical protein
MLLLRWAWWYTSVIPTVRRLRQEDYKFKASLGYREFWASLGNIVTLCLKNRNKQNPHQKQTPKNVILLCQGLKCKIKT